MLNGWTLLSLYLVGSGLLVLLGLPLQRAWVPTNRWYGFRTQLTLSNPKIWYEVNRITGFWLMATGFATAATSTITHLWKCDIIQAAIINAIAYGVGLVVTTVRSLALLKKHREK